ncbi:MAG: DUF1828 domain-containing protein [Planctomycetaceae bacterium]|nr:DUF1828 domain-containing protein [Planctomycetaceae bacterium]
MTAKCVTAIEQITSYFGSHLVLESLENDCAIRTPFLFPDNTPITIYVREDDQNIIVSDRGETSDFAFVNGVGERMINNQVKRSGRRLGFEPDGDEMVIVANPNDVGEATMRLINAIQEVGSLVNMRRYRQPKKEFGTEVERFLIQHNRAYERNVLVHGKARNRKINYKVSGDGPRQLYLWVFDSPGGSAERRADEISMSYIDIHGAMPDDQQSVATQFAVVVKRLDSENVGAKLETAISQLNEYLPNVIMWDGRHKLEELLSAA